MPTPPDITRTTTGDRLETARSALQTVLAGVDEATLNVCMATQEWTALDILRHIWVWNELCARCLEDWLGSRDWIISFAGEDQFNLEMVAARAGTTLEQIVAGIEQAYHAYTTVLAGCSDAELAEQAAAPWGRPLTRTELIWFELEHDLMHIEQLHTSLNEGTQL